MTANEFVFTVRPENDIEEPSVEEVCSSWEQEVPDMPNDDDGLPFLCFKKDRQHVRLHREPGATGYTVATVFAENEGFIYISDYYDLQKASQIYLLGGILVFGDLLTDMLGISPPSGVAS